MQDTYKIKLATPIESVARAIPVTFQDMPESLTDCAPEYSPVVSPAYQSDCMRAAVDPAVLTFSDRISHRPKGHACTSHSTAPENEPAQQNKGGYGYHRRSIRFDCGQSADDDIGSDLERLLG